MDLIPIEHTISTDVENDLVLATLYEGAGMQKMARSIRKKCIERICEDNGIPLIRAHDDNKMIIGSHIIYNWQGENWDLKDIERCLVPVPVLVLQKMKSVKDQSRLKIAVPRTKIDPVLLYRLPFFDETVFIELARWE